MTTSTITTNTIVQARQRLVSEFHVDAIEALTMNEDEILAATCAFEDMKAIGWA